jgi:hypothetical protein
MGTTNFSGGVSSYGVPVLPGVPLTTGKYWFVCNRTGANGSNGNPGDRADQPFATMQGAIAACTAGNGDVIIVGPGHAETVTATSIALNVAGVQIYGVGEGLARPTFTFGAAAATITVSAANCSWSGCHFKANFVDVAAAFTLGAAKDFRLENNTFLDISSILNFLSIVVTGATANAADGLKVLNNWYQGLAATANAFVSILGNCDRLIINDNHVDKLATNDAGQFVTIAALVLMAAQIKRNTLQVLGATGSTVGIFLTGSSTTNTGVVSDNRVASLDTTTELISTTGTKFKFFENYYTGTADATGKLWPAVDAA